MSKVVTVCCYKSGNMFNIVWRQTLLFLYLCIVVIVMVVFIVILLIVIVYSILSGAILGGQKWIRGIDYNYRVHGRAWVTARVITNKDKKEITVKYNPKDNHFYDKEGTGYHIAEIYIKTGK